MISSPKVSVVTTCLDHPIDFLAQAAISLQSQTYRGFEWIVCSDGAPVGPILDTINKTLKKSSKLCCGVFGVNHGGRSRAIDLAIKQSKGEFIVLLDSDDWLDPRCLGELVERSGRFDMVFGSHIEHILDEHSADLMHYEIATTEHPIKSALDILHNPGLYFHPCLFPRKLYNDCGGTDRKLKACVDLDLYLRMAAKTSKIVKVPSAIYHYRKHQNQMRVTHAADQKAVYQQLLISYTGHPSEKH